MVEYSRKQTNWIGTRDYPVNIAISIRVAAVCPKCHRSGYTFTENMWISSMKLAARLTRIPIILLLSYRCRHKELFIENSHLIGRYHGINRMKIALEYVNIWQNECYVYRICEVNFRLIKNKQLKLHVSIYIGLRKYFNIYHRELYVLCIHISIQCVMQNISKMRDTHNI